MGSDHGSTAGKDVPTCDSEGSPYLRRGEVSAATKFERMLAFGEMLPRIRRKVSRALQVQGIPREKVLAAVVQLLDITLIRVGNDEYARQNSSYQDVGRKCSGAARSARSHV